MKEVVAVKCRGYTWQTLAVCSVAGSTVVRIEQRAIFNFPGSPVVGLVLHAHFLGQQHKEEEDDTSQRAQDTQSDFQNRRLYE